MNYFCCQLVDINRWGITVNDGKTNIDIFFEECAKNYANEKSLETSRCVATRDITRLTFVFYSIPKVKIVFKKHFFKDLFSEKSAVNHFLSLQDAINKYGYTSYDLS